MNSVTRKTNITIKALGKCFYSVFHFIFGLMTKRENINRPPANNFAHPYLLLIYKRCIMQPRPLSPYAYSLCFIMGEAFAVRADHVGTPCTCSRIVPSSLKLINLSFQDNHMLYPWLYDLRDLCLCMAIIKPNNPLHYCLHCVAFLWDALPKKLRVRAGHWFSLS